ncbi:tyrosine-protein phosphatase [Thermodesulfobacteriota bacterium]
MIDIHCHILPEVDDGPQSLKTALKMARIAVKDGVDTIIATPHSYDGAYNCQPKDIIARCNKFNDILNRENIKLSVLPGAEVRLTPEFLVAFDQGKVLTLGNSYNALLLELPDRFIPDAVVRIIKKLKIRGIICILAHPEKNSLLLSRNEILKELVFAGAELQITADSLTGGCGRESKLMAQKCILMNVRCYLASDGHDTWKRKPVMSKALKVASKLVGKNAAHEMVNVDFGDADYRMSKLLNNST